MKKIYGSWLGNYPIFKQLYYMHDKIIKLIYKNDIIRKIKYKNICFNIKFNLNDGFVSKELFMKKIYEEEITSIFYDEVREEDAVIDIGANIWYFSLLSSKIVWNLGKVYAFEPSIDNFKKLEKNIQINSISNTDLLNFWLWNNNEQLEINVDPTNIWHNSLVKDLKGWKKESIEVKTFDSLLDSWYIKNFEKIKLIKIDVEWFEFEVLLGMKRFLKSYRWIIILEFSPIFYWKKTNDFIDFIYNNKFISHKINSNWSTTEIDLYQENIKSQVNILLKRV